MRHCSPLALSILLVAIVSTAPAAEPNKKGVEFFEKKIRPVLTQHCYQCHAANAKKIKGKLLLDTRGGTLAGGETGAAIVPGKPEESLLISALRHTDFEMPPNQKLPKAVVADFVKWIEMGAPDPRGSGSQPGVIQKKIDLDQGRKFWAFQPVKAPQPPTVKSTAWPRDDIDRFVLQKLEAKGLKPVGDADRLTLIRRVYYDLAGLPPTPKQVEAFLNDKSKRAFEKVVDQLLDSPHFGQRWGRHWLDVAHYAESNGNVRNFTFPHAWRYRDWVIDALNRDLPYDRFVTEQLAGDLLPGTTAEQRNAQKVATGFLVMMSKPQKGKTLAMDLIAEEIEVSTRAFMALTVACARCHDHKFDPIPTSDYYALAGIFTSSEALYGGTGANGTAPKTDLHAFETDDPKVEQARRAHQQQVAALKKRQAELAQLIKKNGRKKNGKKKGKKNKKATDEAAKLPPTVDVAKLRQDAKRLTAQLKKIQAGGPKGQALAMGVRERGKCNESQVYLKGETPKGTPIPRGFVTVATLGQPPKIPADHSGRLELAQWLTRGDHPLTSRVMVNRIWHHLFGTGIVRTVDNFGINGQRPSHPELLDHLATRFVREGWSVKRMIRAIVLSRSYQLSSDHDDRGYEADPDNRLIWRKERRRLDAEALRDSILAASGDLDLTPAKASIVAGFGDRIIRDNFTVDAFRVTNRHRSVYLPIVRNGIPEVLGVFDFADPSLVVGRRNITTVPAQELFLMNSPLVIEQSTLFAKSLLARADLDDAGRIDLAYRRALARGATPQEIQRVQQYLGQNVQQNDKANLTGWAGFCQAIYVSAEFRYIK